MPERITTPATVLRIILFGFLAGIAFASFDAILVRFSIFIVLVILSSRAILRLPKGIRGIFALRVRPRALFVLGILGAVSFWCSLQVYAASSPAQNSIARVPSGEYKIEGTVENVSFSDRRQKLTISSISLEDQTYEDRIIIFSPLFPKFTYGARLSLTCELQDPEPFDGFAYDRFLAAKRIYKTCFSYHAPSLIESHTGNRLLQFSSDVKNEFLHRINLVFGEPHGALLAGLLFGEKQFSDEWEERFIATGTSHIVAASGYNITIVTIIVFAFLTSIGIRRQKAFWLLFAGVVAYVIFAGAEAAVVRAGVMAVLILTSRHLGRRADMLNVILLAAAIMLAVNPRLLRDDVGFQLSFLSTIGLIYFTPLLEKKFTFVPKEFAIRESLTSTLAATLFTLPIILISFGRFSPVSLIANLLILPLVPYAMAAGSVIIIISLFSLTLASIASAPAWALLSIILLIIKSLASLF